MLPGVGRPGLVLGGGRGPYGHGRRAERVVGVEDLGGEVGGQLPVGQKPAVGLGGDMKPVGHRKPRLGQPGQRLTLAAQLGQAAGPIGQISYVAQVSEVTRRPFRAPTHQAIMLHAGRHNGQCARRPHPDDRGQRRDPDPGGDRPDRPRIRGGLRAGRCRSRSATAQLRSRPGDLGRDAARPRWFRSAGGGPADQPGGRADADRPGRAVRPPAGSDLGRRRLSGQTVRHGRAGGPGHAPCCAAAAPGAVRSRSRTW